MEKKDSHDEVANLIRRNLPRIKRIARQLSWGTWHIDVSDIAQEAVLRVLKRERQEPNASVFESDATFLKWISGVLRNVVHEHNRRIFRERKRRALINDVTNQRSPDDIVSEVNDAISRLPSPINFVLTERQKGVSFDRIAVELRKSRATVHRYFEEGRRRILESL